MGRHKKVGRKPLTPAKKRQSVNNSVSKSIKKTMTAFTFRFHNVNDKEVIDTLKSKENKMDYIRQLILEDIKKNG